MGGGFGSVGISVGSGGSVSSVGVVGCVSDSVGGGAVGVVGDVVSSGCVGVAGACVACAEESFGSVDGLVGSVSAGPPGLPWWDSFLFESGAVELVDVEMSEFGPGRVPSWDSVGSVWGEVLSVGAL